MTKIANREYLIIGATGMLAPLCEKIPSNQLIISARFISNQNKLENFSSDILKIALDYTDEQSKAEFLSQLVEWQQLKYCILWVHSYAYEFSCQLIETFAKFNNDVKIIHTFGSTADDSQLIAHAQKYEIDFYPVRLGTKQTATGQRWLTHNEISDKVYQVLQQVKNG